MSEKELLDCLNKDASQGIQVAIDLYGNAVKTICYSILSGYSREDVEETISDVFVGLWKARNQIVLVEDTGIKSYLYGIARRTALNKKRSLAKKKPTEDIEELTYVASQENVEEEAVRRADYMVLQQLISDMKSPDKEIFLYRYYQQNSIKEIAEKLHMKTKAVENKLARGKKKLRSQLIKNGIEVA